MLKVQDQKSSSLSTNAAGITVEHPQQNPLAPDAYGSSCRQKAKEEFRIGELNPGLVGTDHLSMTESDKS